MTAAAVDGQLRIGIVSWTDPDLVKSGKFYPKGSSSPEERLAYYSGKFPIVEVDMSTYRVPDPHICEKWAKATSQGFIFHFKIYHIWTHGVVDVPTLPPAIAKQLPESISRKGKVLYDELSDHLKKELWAEWNRSLRPIHAAGKLGTVLFQFPASFGPSRASEEHIAHCRAFLDRAYLMSVELRHTGWFSDANVNSTLTFLRENNLSLVWVDEPRDGPFQSYQLRDPALALPEHASFLKAIDKQETTTAAAAMAQVPESSATTVSDSERVVIKREPIEAESKSPTPPTKTHQLVSNMYAPIEVTNPEFVYVRVHRRSGENRLLTESELNAWAVRFRAKAPEVKCFWMVWNTHHDNHAVLNALAMAKLVPELCYDWNKHIGQGKGKLEGLFARAREKAAGTAVTQTPVIELSDSPPPSQQDHLQSSKSHPVSLPAPTTPTKKPKALSAPSPGTGSITSFFKKAS